MAERISNQDVLELVKGVLQDCRATCPHIQPDMSGMPRFMRYGDRCGSCAVRKASYALEHPEDFERLQKRLQVCICGGADNPAGHPRLGVLCPRCDP